MPTYIALCNWTQQGISNVKDSPTRLDQAKAAIESAGGKLTNFYMTMGQYDMVVVSEAPSDEAYAKVMLALSSQGGVRTQTLKAFTETEYRSILAGL